MKQKASITAQRLLNLYRQEHVIIGGWATINPIFVADADDDVIDELKTLPTGTALVQHIKNLRDGTTPMDGIERELMPYGGMMDAGAESIILTTDQWNELTHVIDDFIPNQSGLDALQSTPIIHRFGDEWPVAIRTAIVSGRPELLEKWENILKTHRAYTLWNTATDMLGGPISERTRAEFQVEMPEYETYLPMFGDAGVELLSRLRQFITTREEVEVDNPNTTIPGGVTSI